ncbi:MAG: V-type ATP synthase subunit I [Synergistaceae bacterium]|nr:V-type ATP synthase subunit I [Synergistaceae bacterium]
MAVTSVKKAEFYIHKTDVNGVLAALQNTGSYEVMPFSDANGDDVSRPVHPDLQRVESNLGEARFLLRFLEPHFKDNVSSLARTMGDRTQVSLTEAKKIESSTDIKDLAERMRVFERRLMEIRSELSQLESTKTLLSGMKGFPYPLEMLTFGTERVRGVFGSLPADQVEQWRKEAESILGSQGEVYIIKGAEKDKEIQAALFYEESFSQKATELNGRYSFSRIDLPASLRGSVENEVALGVERMKTLTAEEESILSKMKAESQKSVPTIHALSDYWNVLRDRYLSLSSGGSTEQVVMLRGWIPESKVAEVRSAVKSFDNSVELLLSDPEEDDTPPSYMRNSSWVLPFENLTRLYGAPKYGELDPTPLLAPFFFVFFGMCLGDAGYGLLMVGFFTLFIRKYKRMPGTFKQFFQLFVLSGIAAIFVGILTGSFFGDIIDAFDIFAFLRPLKNAPVLLNPMENPMVFLAISLALGVVQLLFGLGIAFYDALRKRNYVEAFADTGGWVVFLVGLLLWGGVAANFLPPETSTLARTLTILGAVVLIATQGREKTGILSKLISGLLSLYGVTSYLGDVLSYSRLLALGLATTAVAVIINMLAGLASGVPYVGWLIAIVLLIGGHLFSVAVNVLGAFVHSLRLQYVEFFSKFYTGGGRVFSPLTYKTNYVDIIKDPAE